MLPTLFLSHGSPLHALEPGPAGAVWAALGRELPRPRAVLVASAHWETNLPLLTGATKPDTIHDFFGFPEPLYRIRYAAPGAPELAARALALLKDAGFTAAIEGCRGLDHGAWSPLLHMYPQADVPVVQLALQSALGPRHHYRVGQALEALRGEEVLVIGSGHLTHNLREWRGAARTAPAPYVREFQDWVHARLTAGEVEALLEYRSQAPHAARAHPTEEHFLPLYVALGAAGAHPAARRLYDAIESGVLAMDAYRFG